jgi:hypothetical protein
MRLSGIIADILDPRGSHGQGTLFLGMFISRLNRMLPPDRQMATEDLDATTTNVEVTTNSIETAQRRIDIVLENTHWVLGIENKPWAAEQDRQLEDYRRHLENQCRNKAIPCHILFISGSCSMPQTDGENMATLVMGYSWNEEACELQSKFAHLCDWLEEAEKHCRADKVRHFLGDFCHWVKDNFKHQTGTGHQKEELS